MKTMQYAFDIGGSKIEFGVADETGALNITALRELMTECSGLLTTLHRVFDEVPDQMVALEQAFDRILTSGGASDALTGAEQISKLITASCGRIGILPGAGIGPDNARDVLRITGADELHASCKMVGRDASGDTERVAVDPERVRALRAIMDQ